MENGSIVYSSTLRGQVSELRLVDAPSKTFQLRVDGILQSEVCLTDSTIIGFAYARQIARLIDAVTPVPTPGRRMLVAHFGGGALTLPRYVAARWPTAVQYVVESEAERTTDLLGILPLPEQSDVRFLFSDARTVVDAAPAWSDASVTVVDLWAGATIAARVASLDFYTGIANGMARDGTLAVNLLDGPGFAWSRRQAATLCLLFAHVVVTIDERMIEQNLIGNVLVFASDRSLDFMGEAVWPPRVLLGERLAEWIGDAQPVSDADATDSPPPDTAYFAQFTKHPGDHVGYVGDRSASGRNGTPSG